MRRVHSDRQEPRHACTHYRLHSHARRMQSATIRCYDCDCGGHRVQRPPVRELVDGARSRSRILSRRNHRLTVDWHGCSRPLEPLAARRTRAVGRARRICGAAAMRRSWRRDSEFRPKRIAPRSSVGRVSLTPDSGMKWGFSRRFR